MPFILGVIFLIIYVWFLEYDRCLQDIDTAMITVEVSSKQGLSIDEKRNYTEKLILDMYREQYFSWNTDYAKTDIDINRITVEMSGSLLFPFHGLNFWDIDDLWIGESKQTGRVINRVFLLRAFRKLKRI